MRGCCWRTIAALAATWSFAEAPVAGQLAGTLEIGASVVEYDGFLVSGAAVVSPTFRYDARSLAVGAQGTWTRFESGNQIFQGTAAAAWLIPFRDRFGIELSGAAGASRYASEPASGHVITRSRIHALLGQRSGAWITGATGGSIGDSTQVPFEIGVGLWSLYDRLAVVGTLGGSWLGDSRHVDLRTAVRWTGTRLEVEARTGVRPWTQSGGGVGEALTGAWGDISLLFSLSERASVAVSGGSYPSDPVRRVLGAKYVNAGFRLTVFGAERSPAALLESEALAAVRDPPPDRAGEPRIEVFPTDSLHTVRIHAPGAAFVELMGDFTDWRAVSLAEVENGTWEVRLPMTAGVHRVNIRVDGGAWVVPAGARSEAGDFGDAVGVIVVRSGSPSGTT